jgi:hypothetical protein
VKHIAAPLPECRLCEAPTRRDAWERNGQLCTECATGIADTVRMLPIGRATLLSLDEARRARLAAQGERLDDATAYVERYRPPVPGQLELPEED